MLKGKKIGKVLIQHILYTDQEKDIYIGTDEDSYVMIKICKCSTDDDKKKFIEEEQIVNNTKIKSPYIIKFIRSEVFNSSKAIIMECWIDKTLMKLIKSQSVSKQKISEKVFVLYLG
jgi:hypothetical protein